MKMMADGADGIHRNSQPPEHWLGRAVTFGILSIGRLMALFMLGVLMAFVLLLAAYLVLPSEVFSSVFPASPNASFIKPNLKETLAAACATFFVITLFLWV